MTAPSRSITPAEQLEMIKRMEEKSVRKSFNDSREPSKQDLKVLVSIKIQCVEGGKSPPPLQTLFVKTEFRRKKTRLVDKLVGNCQTVNLSTDLLVN